MKIPITFLSPLSRSHPPCPRTQVSRAQQVLRVHPQAPNSYLYIPVLKFKEQVTLLYLYTFHKKWYSWGGENYMQSSCISQGIPVISPGINPSGKPGGMWGINSGSYLLSSSSTQSYPQAAAVSKFLSSHSSVAGSFTSDSAARCTPYLSPNRQMKKGAHRPILSKHMRRTCSLFCWDWFLFQRKSTGINDVPRSLHILFSWGNILSCKKSRSAWKSWKVEQTKGRMISLRAASLLAVDKLEPSRSFGIDREKIAPYQNLLITSV